MTERMYWHGWHNQLCAYLDPEARAQEIRETKPGEELPTRFRLMQPVRGRLPAAVVSTSRAFFRAQAKFGLTRARYDLARAKFSQPCAKYDLPGAKYEQARVKVNRAWGKHELAWGKREQAWGKREQAWGKYAPQIEALHKLECLDCPWDGKTIFPKEVHHD